MAIQSVLSSESRCEIFPNGQMTDSAQQLPFFSISLSFFHSFQLRLKFLFHFFILDGGDACLPIYMVRLISKVQTHM